ncbi:CIP1 protein [Scheffersomyces xylosifermentans]|uniref:CIP1 protein n=1 Tax=Scheffersomyces xylosifermentans TaxID=1304137 RepID=UPI00315DCA43
MTQNKVSLAVFGNGGFLGKPVHEAIASGAFDDKLTFPVKVLTRTPTESDDKFQYIVANLDDAHVDEIARDLTGVDTIAVLVTANAQLLEVVERIVEKVKPKLYIPSEFGFDTSKVDQYAPGVLGFKRDHARRVRAQGIKTVQLVTSYFASPGAFLYEWVGSVGIDEQKGTYVQRGDLDTKFAITFVPDIAKSIVSLSVLNPESIPDVVKVQSDNISFQDVINRYEKDHNVKLELAEKISIEQTTKEMNEKLASGFKLEDLFFYVHSIAAHGLDKGMSYSQNENELINPGESLWKWTKY